ncbi:hypothetical protein D3C81_2172920 [compost metagenome]
MKQLIEPLLFPSIERLGLPDIVRNIVRTAYSARLRRQHDHTIADRYCFRQIMSNEYPCLPPLP